MVYIFLNSNLLWIIPEKKAHYCCFFLLVFSPERHMCLIDRECLEGTHPHVLIMADRDIWKKEGE